ncbi:hypothetical protein N7541_007980 [Penicillium brevicompactum]|uniref:Uncharacterized protein n=1 Tax=Penicillium brevicompactum TaxID=5074 RepID=A0A9W9QY71_PENBR|nr:uncharacterized protein N7506_003321 [Penicillium brevicompactum]KAJ5343497.1 hypothetical protein N7506_003321 [Penicillium brevicompactum]KAJ5350253.1 hypothetical protein N7541_007980 [Penicillium brevicompactum]
MSEVLPSAVPDKQQDDPKKVWGAAGKSSQEPGIQGPGASATAPEKPKPHASKVLNKLDPRQDSDIVEAERRGEFGNTDAKPGVSK